MSEMVERVARALFELEQKSLFVEHHNQLMYGAHPVTWEFVTSGCFVPHVVDEYYEKARAAIEAMREPTEAMQIAGATTNVEIARTAANDGRCLTPGLIWRSMHAAILGRPVES